MNLNKIIFLVLLIFPVPYTYGQECKAKIFIRTDIPSSRVYVNNEFAGKGNTAIELEKGVYNIVVMEESDRWNAKSFSDTLNIKNCSDTTLTYNFKSEVYLDTDPQDVYVYQDSSLIGHTPLFLTVNNDEVILKKPGFEDKVLKVNEIKSGEKIDLNFTGEAAGKNFFEKNIFKILVGGILALGGVTAYYKLKADDYFDQYQLYGDKYDLDQTHKFDLISGITFGALQVGFGFLIYYFLSD